MSKKKKEPEYDTDTEINKLPVSNMFKNGFKFFIKTNKIKITDEKELQKALKKYSEMEIGGA